MSTRILIADDHPVVRQGLRMFLSLEPDFDVVGEAQDGTEAVRLAQEQQRQLQGWTPGFGTSARAFEA